MKAENKKQQAVYSGDWQSMEAWTNLAYHSFLRVFFLTRIQPCWLIYILSVVLSLGGYDSPQYHILLSLYKKSDIIKLILRELYLKTWNVIHIYQ